MFGILGKYVPPAPGPQSPALWGDVDQVEELFSGRAASIAATPREFSFRYRSAAHFVDVFRSWYGPVHKAFGTLPEAEPASLERDLIDLLERSNTADGALVIPSEYLEVVVTRA